MNEHDGRWLSYRRPLGLLLSGILSALLLSNAYGQEPTPVPKQPPEKTTQAEKPENSTAPVKAQDDKPASKPTSEAFRPSEEISEDLSVPFPVDI